MVLCNNVNFISIKVTDRPSAGNRRFVIDHFTVGCNKSPAP